MFWHRHYWREHSRSFVPPIGTLNLSGTEIRGRDSIESHHEFMRQLAFGVTSVSLKCFECGDMKNIVLIGDHTHHER